MKNQFLSLHLDFIGFSTSLLCAIHCAVLPLLISILPLAGFQFLKNPWVEFSITLLSFILASVALLRGFNTHKNKSPLVIVSLGFVLIFLGHLFESSRLGILLLTIGAMAIAFAHYRNWKYLKNSSTCYSDLNVNKASSQTEDKNSKAA